MSQTKKRLPSKIGPYAIKSRIGEGGMGEVLLGEHPLLNRPVAIKKLLGDMADSEEMAERFLREGQALAQLNHQGICAVHDLFERKSGDAKTTYMVLEFVDGYDVDFLLKTAGPLPPDVASIICMRVAEALEHAHLHRILHRDIKPANIMVSRSGDVKLMDFGIARDEDLDRVTKTGLMVGTPMYMAPEVVTGDDADERSDVYSLGAMLYQCVSGRKLFAHANKDNLFALIATGKFPSIRKVAPGVPRALRRIIDKSLQRRPDKRYQDASELRQDLAGFLANHHAWANHAERIVSYLHSVGQISEDEALTVIDADLLAQTADFELVAPRSPWRTAAMMSLVVGLAVAGGLAFGAKQGWFDEYLIELGVDPEGVEDVPPGAAGP